MVRLNSGIRNRFNFFLGTIFSFQKNNTDSGDNKVLVQFPGIRFWNQISSILRVSAQTLYILPKFFVGSVSTYIIIYIIIYTEQIKIFEIWAFRFFENGSQKVIFITLGILIRPQRIRWEAFQKIFWTSIGGGPRKNRRVSPSD